MFPTNLFLRVKYGSNFNPTPIKPPGTAYNKSLVWFASNDIILEYRGFTLYFPLLSLINSPGLISIISPTRKIPLIKVPLTTPPFNLSYSVPGLFISNERIIINLGGDIKSLFGIGKSHK